MMKASELIKKAEEINALNTSYIWGGIGRKITEKSLKEKVDQYPSTNAKHAANAKRFLNNGYMFDCVCLIKAILWGWTKNKADIDAVPYAKNGVPDINADSMIGYCKASSNFGTIVPGEVVWMSGHIGIYIGNGFVIECTPAWENGVQKTALLNLAGKPGYNGRYWTKHGRLPWVDYEETTAKDDHEGKIMIIVNGKECWVPGSFEKGTNSISGTVREIFGAMGAEISNKGSTPVIRI